MPVTFRQISPRAYKVEIDGRAVADYYEHTGNVCLTTSVSEQGQAAIADAIKSRNKTIEKIVPAPPEIPDEHKIDE